MSEHNLGEYAVAKQMMEYIPAALKALEKAQDDLYPHRGFNVVCDAMIQIQSAIINLETRMPYFQNIVENKGEKK